MVLPVLFVVLAAVIWVVACLAAQLRCVDAAALAARAAARGETREVVTETAQAAGPAGSRVEVRQGMGDVEVTVRAQVRPFGGALQGLPEIPVSGRAVAAREDTVGVTR